MNSLWRAVRFGTWIVYVCLIAGCQSLGREPSGVDHGMSTWLACPPDGSLSDDEVARSLGISLSILREVQQNRRRTNAELCSLKPDKLTREVGLARVARPLGASDHEFRLSRFRNGDGSIDPMIGSRSRNARTALELSRKAGTTAQVPSDVVWSSIGPGNMGGRILTIAIDATDGDRIFIGAASGGVWYSPDAGQSWSCVTDSLGNVGAAWIAQDPNDTSTFYATSGEFTKGGLTGGPHSTFGIGILVSRDRGLNWSILNETSSSMAARRLVAIPGMPQVLVTTNSELGIYRSVDGGGTWSQARPPELVPWNNVSLSTLPYELVVDPANPAHLMAGDFLSGLTHSYDGGATWSARIALPVTPALASGSRVELAFAASQPGLVYATVSPGHLGGGVLNSPYQTRLYRSTDSGATWTFVSYVVREGSAASYRNGNSFINNLLWVDPLDANHIIAGDVAAFRSTNGGQTWSAIVDWSYNTAAGGIAGVGSLHVDHFVVAADPGYNGTTNRRLWLVNDGGVYRTENIALTRDSWSANPGPSPPAGAYAYANLNSHLPITQFYAASGGANRGGFLVGGSQDNGTWKIHSIAGDNAALQVAGGDAFTNVIDPAGSGAFFATSQNGFIVRLVPDANYAIGYAQDFLWNGYSGEPSSFVTFIGLDPNYRDRLLMAGNSLWLSANPWAQQPTRTAILAADPDPSNYLAAFAVAPTDSNTIWAMRVNKGQLHKTTNGLAAQPTWQTSALPVGNARGINVYVDPGNANIVYALYGGNQGKNIWRTLDGGTTWQDITGNLPGPAYVLIRHPSNASWLYAGAESGVYFSADGGATWYATADSPRNVAVEDLFWYDSNTLIAATYGRGLYRATTPGSTSTTLVSSRNPSTAGASVAFTATVSGLAPAASVAFTDGGATIAGCGAITLTGTGNVRTATCTTSALTPGAHTIVANYAGDTANAASTSAPVYEIVSFVETGNTIQFANAAYNVNERAGGLTVSVIRTGDVSAPASVSYSTLPGTAAANVDFAGSTGTLFWATGDSAPKSINITVFDDALIEPNETLDVVLSNPIGTVIGARSTTSVTIFDDESAVVSMPGTATVVANPYGTLSVQGATLNGNTISGLQKNAVIQLGSAAGSPSSFAEIDFQGFNIGPGNLLTLRSGASGQSVVLRNVDARASIIAGVLQAQGGNGAPPPAIYLQNRSGISVASGGNVIALSGLALDTLGNTPTTGESLINQGVLDGGSSLRLLVAKVNGGGAFRGNTVFVGTFGNANNPANGSHFLANSLQLYPGSGNDVALTLNHYGGTPQVLNLMVNGNATVTMPSAWPVGSNNPANNSPVPPGGSRPPGTPEPSYGGGSMIVQATGSLKLQGGVTNDFGFPGGIVLKAGGDLDLNGVLVNQGWNTAGRAFQGVFFESPNIVSTGNIQVLSNNLNWVNFSTFPHAPVRTWTLVQVSDGSAQYVTADTIAPHLNTYSIVVETAVAGQCWACVMYTSPVNMY